MFPLTQRFATFFISWHTQLITKILWHTKKHIIFFANLTKKIDSILVHSHWMAIVVLAVVIFLFDNLREKRSVPLTKQSGIACFQSSCSVPVETCCSQDCNMHLNSSQSTQVYTESILVKYRNFVPTKLLLLSCPSVMLKLSNMFY